MAVCLSDGGIPKLPQESVRVTAAGIAGDEHEHLKHAKAIRAISLFDEEIMLQLCEEGYRLAPGSIGENITLRNVHVQKMQPGTLLQLGEIVIKLEEPRKPCFVLDAIDEKLKEEIVGRCGYMASVVKEGTLTPGVTVTDVTEQHPVR